MNKQFGLLEFVFDSVYVDLQYDEIALTFTAGSVSLCCVCSHVVAFGMFVVVHYVDAVVAVTVMRVMLFVCVYAERVWGARVTAMVVWGMDEVCLWRVQGMLVVHMVQVLCLVQLKCYG